MHAFGFNNIEIDWIFLQGPIMVTIFFFNEFYRQSEVVNHYEEGEFIDTKYMVPPIVYDRKDRQFFLRFPRIRYA